MASDIDLVERDAPDTAIARIPEAVWINRPNSEPRWMRLATKLVAAAIALGLAALAARYLATELAAVVPSAVAATEAGVSAGDGSTGYFPAQFDQRKLAPGEQPPTF